MKRTNLLIAVAIVMVLILSACAAPAAAPAGDSGSAAAGGEAVAALTCDDAIGCVEVDADEPIHIATMLTISGATAFLGEDSEGGVEIAIDDFGPLKGHEVDVTKEDVLCSAERGQTAD